ncbi:substrate-binding periplasmic protein [Simiduia agarivorans]|uniref:Uncharacterized protein n=1 Tax=Simiduia agarivorans (strain DSM 21679 / JCM 13881 / BCRC 17597 / SA1) TaxID=1117647 RepID=K4KRN7_SIMAS|nr:transporter substrate-binding domain-containing protein [Simiduia agarivorans]AFV00956.1 hypothetical protein M5M_19145 [Simiduia agarivorans SA1 = DSM 21679]
MSLAVKRNAVFCPLSVAGLLLCLCFLCAPVSADQPAPHLPLVVTPLVEPWGFIDAAGAPQGLLVRFQRELFQRAGLRYEQRMRPYPRVIHDLSIGRGDFGVMFSSPQADAVGRSLGAVVTMRVLLVSRVQPETIQGLNDLAGLRVGYVRGSKYGPLFDNNPTFERIPVNSAEQGLRMLMTHRLDAMASTEQALIYASVITGIPTGHLQVAFELGKARADFYVSHSNTQVQWHQSLQQTLAAMAQDGSLRRLFYQHDLWPQAQYCFAGGRCLRADDPVAVQKEPDDD